MGGDIVHHQAMSLFGVRRAALLGVGFSKRDVRSTY